jgi:hypothetical protein
MPEAAQPADGLSVLSLAAGIGAVVLILFSVLPLIGWCLGPLSGVSALVALVTGIASLVRTTLRPQLEGRWQALAGIALALLWGAGAAVLALVVWRHANGGTGE